MAGLTDFLTALNPGSLILSLGSKLIDNLIPDPAQQAAAKIKLLEMQQQGQFKEIDTVVELAKQQTDVNKVEAASPSIFIGGWRPFSGWVAGLSLFYVALGEPLLRFVSTVFLQYNGSFPVLDTSITFQVLMGMLGLGGLRTYEKMKGVAQP